jgi:hypothetical protein
MEQSGSVHGDSGSVCRGQLQEYSDFVCDSDVRLETPWLQNKSPLVK